MDDLRSMIEQRQSQQALTFASKYAILKGPKQKVVKCIGRTDPIYPSLAY